MGEPRSPAPHPAWEDATQGNAGGGAVSTNPRAAATTGALWPLPSPGSGPILAQAPGRPTLLKPSPAQTAAKQVCP